MTWLCSNGHIASTAALRSRGVTRRGLARAIERGNLVRLRIGLYACAHLDEQQWDAARTGGLIDCTSALARQPDVWSGPDDSRLHVRLAPHGHRLGLDGAVVHWREQFGVPLDVTVSAEDALLQAMSCLDPYDALAAIESSLHLGYLPRKRTKQLLARAPERMNRALTRLNFLAQSGLETHTRLRLEDAGHRVECQVSIPGAGRIDLLVDGCVGVETDGRKWHDGRFIQDRTKDVHVAMWGIPVVRLAKVHVIEKWPETLFAIEQLVAQQRRQA